MNVLKSVGILEEKQGFPLASLSPFKPLPEYAYSLHNWDAPVWDKVKDSIERTVEYFKNYYRIPVSQLLPYSALIAPFSYFFFYHTDKPTGDKQKFLEDFFWRCALSGRYSSAVESKLAQDVKIIDQILTGELPSYDWSIDTSEDFIKNNGWFNAARSQTPPAKLVA